MKRLLSIILAVMLVLSLMAPVAFADGEEIVISDIVSRYADCAAPVVTAGNKASTGKVTLKWKEVSGVS